MTMTSTTKTYNSLLDDRDIGLVRSISSGTLHVKAWFGETACGHYCEDWTRWEFKGLTNLRHIGRMSQMPRINNFCANCAKIYKDVDVDA